MSSILNRVQLFLTEANKASVPISRTIINEFGEACKDAFIELLNVSVTVAIL